MTTIELASRSAPPARLDDLAATEPPEGRGLARDEVRLLTAGKTGLRHTLFHRLVEHLEPGDLLVVNISATLPAAVDGRRGDGTALRVHFSGPSDDGTVVIELRDADGRRLRDGRVGEQLTLPDGDQMTLLSAHPDSGLEHGSRLWRARLPGDPVAYLHRVGRPITYDYVRGQWPLAAYQTIFAREPGSAEMPSAGRPFSPRLVTDLVSRGVGVAPIVLHTGVSSLEKGEAPLRERFRVPQPTARLINMTRAAGSRVIAVGTTVARAVETCAQPDGTVTAASGWTDLVLSERRPARAVQGLITGWHEPDASHLQLLEAVAGAALVAAAYRAAIAERYRWHEFGDSCLLLADS